MSKSIIIANWKMNPENLKEAERLFSGIIKSISDIKKTEIVICPPFIFLPYFTKAIKSEEKLIKISKKIKIGAQDLFFEDSGAYTGEISAPMLYDIGARYAIIGHSERRNPPFSSLGGTIGETNLEINKKIKAALRAGLQPILCVGENLRDENHEYLNFIKIQIEECLDGISKNSISKVIVAYEPVWAIGNGARPATPEEFYEMKIFIRKILSDKFGVKFISGARIIYGGSVDDKNVESFIKEGKADGFLPGRASLDIKKFSQIIKICETSNN